MREHEFSERSRGLFHLQEAEVRFLLPPPAWLRVVWASSEQRLISSGWSPSPSGRNVSEALQQLPDSALIFLLVHEGLFDLDAFTGKVGRQPRVRALALVTFSELSWSL